MLQLSQNIRFLERSSSMVATFTAPELVDPDHFAHELSLGRRISRQEHGRLAPVSEAVIGQLVLVGKVLAFSVSLCIQFETSDQQPKMTNLGLFPLNGRQAGETSTACPDKPKLLVWFDLDDVAML